MDTEGFWLFLERSARATNTPAERIHWLEYRLCRVAPAHVVDFQIHLDTARERIHTYAMWGAADQIFDGCTDDGFWYFQPWLIGLGRYWYQHAIGDPDNLADIPAVCALASRRRGEWADTEWPGWEELDYIAGSAHDQITGEDDSLVEALAKRGHRSHPGSAPIGSAWDFNSPAEIQRRLPRLAGLFPRVRYLSV